MFHNIFLVRACIHMPVCKLRIAKKKTEEINRYSCLCCALDAGQRLLWLPLNQYRVLPSLHAQGAFPAQDNKFARLIRALRVFIICKKIMPCAAKLPSKCTLGWTGNTLHYPMPSARHPQKQKEGKKIIPDAFFN